MFQRQSLNHNDQLMLTAEKQGSSATAWASNQLRWAAASHSLNDLTCRGHPESATER